MKKLEKEFTKSNFWHRQLKRIGKVALYERGSIKHGDSHFEIVKISSHNGYKMGASYIESAETYPGASLWGIQGWTCTDLEKAEKTFKKACKRFNKVKV